MDIFRIGCVYCAFVGRTNCRSQSGLFQPGLEFSLLDRTWRNCHYSHLATLDHLESIIGILDHHRVANELGTKFGQAFFRRVPIGANYARVVFVKPTGKGIRKVDAEFRFDGSCLLGGFSVFFGFSKRC